MKIDNDVELLVRSTLDAAVHRDKTRFDGALAAFPSEEALRVGVAIAAAVGAVALREMYDGNPSDEEVRATAADIAEMESWASLPPEAVYAHLSGLLQGQALAAVDRAVPLAFIVAGSLLASSPKVSEGEHWFDYLNRVEAAVDRAG